MSVHAAEAGVLWQAPPGVNLRAKLAARVSLGCRHGKCNPRYGVGV